MSTLCVEIGIGTGLVCGERLGYPEWGINSHMKEGVAAQGTCEHRPKGWWFVYGVGTKIGQDDE